MIARPDVLIVGAGPAGCATALAFAGRGAETLLLEGPVAAKRRLAGEWLHPAAVRVLEQLDVDLGAIEHCRVAGFIVHPEDASAPISLPYPAGALGLTCRHETLVQTLRDALVQRPGITLVPRARTTAVEGTRVHYSDGGPTLAGDPRQWLVAADGTKSVVRHSLGVPGTPARLSAMAGLLLEDVELEDPNFGHLFIGGPGPMLLYHVAQRTVRVCIDVPPHELMTKRVREHLWQSYSHVLPAVLRGAFRDAVEQGSIEWAGNQFRSRSQYGLGRTAFVGDAVGSFHPLTAVGITLAVADGECLARSPDLETYRRERMAATQVAELLSVALYRTFSANDSATATLRHAVYDLWRRSVFERERTMALLGTEETHLRQFAGSFLHAAAGIPAGGATRALGTGARPQRRQQLSGLGDWLSWLCGAVGHTASLRFAHLGVINRPVPEDRWLLSTRGAARQPA